MSKSVDAYIARLKGCDGLLASAVSDIEAKGHRSRAVKSSSKIARALDDIGHVRQSLLALAYDLAAVDGE